MNNKQIKKDFSKFLATGCDYSQEMRDRDQAAIRRAEVIAQLCLLAAGLVVGFTIAVLLGVAK